MRFEKLWKGFLAAAERSGRARARRELLHMDDRLLADAGFSRVLLELGIEAWPWRARTDDGVVPTEVLVRTPAEREVELEVAADALRRYNDHELADLGIARGDIDRVVREGRPGIDRRAA